MKKIIFFSILAGCFLPESLFAQFVDCKIYYTYDNAGNRIKRSQGCFNPDLPNQPYEPRFPLNAYIYPNPTTGPITVGWNEPVEQARLTIFEIGGSLIGTKETFMCYEIKQDISSHAAGAYMVILSVLRGSGEREQHEFTIIKE